MDLEPERRVCDTEVEFRRIYETALPVVYGFVFVRVAGDKPLAEDLTAEAFAAAAREFRAGRGEVVTLSWLRTVARRRLIDHWRHDRTVKEASRFRDYGDSLADETDTGERDLVLQVLAGLPSDARQALILQHVEGYAVREVSEMLGRTEKATESLLSRARASFRASFLEIDHG